MNKNKVHVKIGGASYTIVTEDEAEYVETLADEISPDTCRFWDSKTHEKLDKDRFRRDLGGVEDAYAEMMKRVGLD